MCIMPPCGVVVCRWWRDGAGLTALVLCLSRGCWVRGGPSPSRLAKSPGQTHQRDQRQAHASNSSGAASRACGVSLLFSSVAHASQMTAHRPRQGAGGHRHVARRLAGTGAQVGTLRTAEQARPPTQHGDVRQHQGRHGPTPPTSRGRTAPAADFERFGSSAGRAGRKNCLFCSHLKRKMLTTPINMALGGIGISFRSTKGNFIV